MEKLTKEQAVVVSAYTGYLVCDFSDMHEEIEKRVGRPVFTHEMGSGAFMDSVRALFKDDFVSLSPVTNAESEASSG